MTPNLTSLFSPPKAKDHNDKNVKDKKGNDDTKVTPLVWCIPAEVGQVVVLYKAIPQPLCASKYTM